MTKLDAVNELLMRTGGLPVTALDTGGASQASIAERFIDRAEIEVQGEGWHYNTLRGVEITLDADGYAHLPDGVIRMDADGEDSGTDTAQVGRRLYDLDPEANGFDLGSAGDTLSTEQIVRYEFGCIPEYVQILIVSTALCRFNASYGDRRRQRELDADHVLARTRARRQEAEHGDFNILNTEHARAVRGQRTNPDAGDAP